MLLLVAQITDTDLVARALLGNDACKLTELCHFLTVNVGDYVAFLQTSILSGSVFHYLSNIDAFHCAEVNLVALLLLSINIEISIDSSDADHGTLYDTVLLQIIDYLIHDSCGNGKSIADI